MSYIIKAVGIWARGKNACEQPKVFLNYDLFKYIIKLQFLISSQQLYVEDDFISWCLYLANVESNSWLNMRVCLLKHIIMWNIGQYWCNIFYLFWIYNNKKTIVLQSIKHWILLIIYNIYFVIKYYLDVS